MNERSWTRPLRRTALSAIGAVLTCTAHGQSFWDPAEECLVLPYQDCPINVTPPPNWFSGDVHDHIQLCDSTVETTADILNKIMAQDLNVSNLLIWDGVDPLENYTKNVCNVTGVPETTPPGFVIQYGVETSGLDTAKFGHLSGLNVGPNEARISIASTAAGDCYDDPVGLGLGCVGGDGTGIFSAPVADHFANNPKAVRGYAHQGWPTGIYAQAGAGYDWNAQLIQTGFTTDNRCLDTTRNLALPFLESIASISAHVMPAYAAMDAALGKIEFLESIDLENDYGPYTNQPARWYGMYYKLLTAGLRVCPAGGTDVDCADISGRTSLPRTYVLSESGLSYDGWTAGLAEGRVTLAMGNDIFLHLTVGGQEVGSQTYLSSPTNQVDIRATLYASCAVVDRIEIVENGQQVASDFVSIPASGGTHVFNLNGYDVGESAWIAARLCSERAHTAAAYVFVDNEPIADCDAAEYWMMWCDAHLNVAMQFPFFLECQFTEITDHITLARKVFKSLRDYDLGFDAGWQVLRIGTSTPTCRGPMAIGIDGPVTAGAAFSLTCANAPPSSTGLAFISPSVPAGGTMTLFGVTLFLDPFAPLAASETAVSGDSGFAENLMPGYPAILTGSTMYAQYVWNNTAECGGAATFSASDALQITVQ